MYALRVLPNRRRKGRNKKRRKWLLHPEQPQSQSPQPHLWTTNNMNTHILAATVLTDDIRQTLITLGWTPPP
jgi:hypothetical protein